MRKQALRYTTTGIVGVVLAVALTIMVNWLAARHYHSADWTSSKMYSISDKTRSILSDLGEEIRVVVFMTPASPLYDQVFELLNRYAAASDKVKVEYIDPDKEPLRTKQLAEQFGISVADTVVFSYGDRTRVRDGSIRWPSTHYAAAATVRSGPVDARAFKGEAVRTRPSCRWSPRRPEGLLLVTGHGRRRSRARVAPGADLAVLAEALKRENIEAVDTVLLSGEVPSDADVLAIVGPTRPFTEPELAALGAFVDRGGRLLVCLDPLIEPAGTMRATRLEGFLATHGIRVNDDLVVDPSRKLPFYDLSAVYLTDFPSHPVVQGLEGIAVLFSVARSLTAEGAAAPVVIVETSAEGWGERNLGQLLAGQPVARDADDTPGPAAVGVVVDEGPESGSSPGDGEAPAVETGSRIVVYGDSDFMADYEISNAGNLILAMNTINWLAAREQSLGIAPREVEQVSLFLSQQQLRTVLLITMLAMPARPSFSGSWSAEAASHGRNALRC
jgi:ABC-type uncharacterized transport system involved in gliding motility auxiliary subunit